MNLGVYLIQQCSVHCLLELYVDHMFWFYRENKCDPGWVFDVIEDCSVHCLLKLYADHMFYFYRENRCDPRCVFDVIEECSVRCLLELSICLYLGTDVTLGVY